MSPPTGPAGQTSTKRSSIVLRCPRRWDLGRVAHRSESRPLPRSGRVLSLVGAPLSLPSFGAEKEARLLTRPSLCWFVGRQTTRQSPAGKSRGRDQSRAGREAFIKPSGRGRAEDQEAQVFMSRPTGPRNPSPLAGSPKPLSTSRGLIRPAPASGQSRCGGGYKTQKGRPGQGGEDTLDLSSQSSPCPRCGSRTEGPKNAG